MKTNNKSILEIMEILKEKKTNYQETANELFKFNYDDFNAVFNIDDITVEKNTYKRVLIFSGASCCAILMLWGSNNQTAIHDHIEYSGLIKVLKGGLTEISYTEDEQFIKFKKESNAPESAIFAEDLGGIHSVINKSEKVAVSLHVYQTPQTSLNGVRLFDLENKRIAYLNEKATSCSWKLPAESYDKIIQI